MKINSTYSVKIKHYSNIFKNTVLLYRDAVKFFIDVCLSEWDSVSVINNSKHRMTYVEDITVSTKSHPVVKYDFSDRFYKFPCYLRRAAIVEAIGKVSSYKSNLNNWNNSDRSTKKPSFPKAGNICPVMYHGNMFEKLDTYRAKVKVFIRNTWDWLTIDLKKSDVNYILKHCSDKHECSPVLQKRGKEWFLDFCYQESVDLNQTDVYHQNILAVDLGLNSACTCSVMQSDGTIVARKFLKLASEYDCLDHAFNRIKKAQQNGNRRMPRLWAKVKGITKDISSKTANYIIDIAVAYSCDVIVFEYLDLSGKKKGRGKQKLHHWKAKAVQSIVSNKAHRNGMRIAHVNAWNTSRLAFDGSGFVTRGKYAGFKSYSLCRFQNNKVYNCDLSASYNIGARYFIREILKSLPEKERLRVVTEVSQLGKRSTCTWIDLVKLNAVFNALVA